ncbi:hypothetical protein AYK24_00305 [Thermoplasmatales archaeon SG8-52-4]|nr:MAG: hypothetical protein AYK24_00305 [Thermoplasmatales archaeon SG8-52-4]
MNLSIYKGNDKTFEIEVTDQDDEIINLSGGQLFVNVTDWQENSKITKSSTDPTQIEITDPEAGLAQIHFVPTDTSSLASDIYVVYINYINYEGKTYTISQGEFQILDLGTISYIRNRIRNFNGDKEELNVLIRALETTDEEMNDYIQKAVDLFNSLGYTTSYTLSDYPNKGNLIEGTVIQILMGKGILSARNMLTYRDEGGITVQDFDTYGRYINLFNVYINRYMQQAMDIKRSLNVDGAYGSIESPMNYVDIWY